VVKYGAVLGLGALLPLVAALGCAKLLGITDTEVAVGGTGPVATSQGGSAGELGNGSGGADVGGGGTASGDDTLGVNQGGGISAGGSGGETPASGACADADARCGSAGREVCSAGQWQAMACPPETPTCDAGKCIVRGPALVSVAGGAFLIDATEVTVGQYAEFVAAKNGDVSGQPEDVCGWNTTYEPADLPNPSDWPASNIDWCDARAYCEWAGKHLCGRIGDTDPVAYADLFVSTVSQWFLACGGPGGSPHVNANSNNYMDPGACNANNGFGNLEPVATNALCEGYYPGVFDLEGNVAEWIDSCGPGADAGAVGGRSDFCMLMGGAIFDSVSYCTEVYDDVRRDDTAVSFGFRCCAG
jgi:formylglycine-generating enzyme required for sulfatase activity